MLRSRGFQRRPAVPAPQDREQRLEARAARALAAASPRASLVVNVSQVATTVPKVEPWRCQAYLRAVAQLPCISCGIYGYSQAAHANTGKGAGTKAHDWMTFPLCCARTGQPGCHALFDQGAVLSKAERRLREPEWVAETLRYLLDLAAFPAARLPEAARTLAARRVSEPAG